MEFSKSFIKQSKAVFIGLTVNLLLLFASSFLGTAFFDTTVDTMESIVENENRKEDGICLATLSTVIDNRGWGGNNIFYKIQNTSSQTRFHKSSENFMFFFTPNSENVQIELPNSSEKQSIAVLGLPYSGATPADYGFNLYSGASKGDEEKDKVYLSFSLSEKMNTQSGSSFNYFVDGTKKQTIVQGILENASNNWIKMLLGDDYILLPYSSAYDQAGSSGKSKLIGFLNNNYYENYRLIDFFLYCERNLSKTEYSVQYFNKTSLGSTTEITNLLQGFSTNKASLSGISKTISILLILLIEFLIIYYAKKQGNMILSKKAIVILFIFSYLMWLFILALPWPSNLVFLPRAAIFKTCGLFSFLSWCPSFFLSSGRRNVC